MPIVFKTSGISDTCRANRLSCRFVIAKLAALVAKPRVNLTRLHGVFAPNSKHRVEVTPAKRGKGSPSAEVVEITPNSVLRHDLGTASQARIQHRPLLCIPAHAALVNPFTSCIGLPKVWRRGQADRQHRGSADHRQASFLRSVNGASMHHFSRSPHEERHITATATIQVATCNAGLTRFRLVCIALGFHTSLHGTATEG
jgi:hypothetical protein